jgi:hypothetical protein
MKSKRHPPIHVDSVELTSVLIYNPNILRNYSKLYFATFLLDKMKGTVKYSQ